MGNRRAGSDLRQFPAGYSWMLDTESECSHDFSLLPSYLTPRTITVALELFPHRRKCPGHAVGLWPTAEPILFSRLVVMTQKTGDQPDGQETE